MAATVSPWGKAGAWALDAEEHEAELLKDREQQVSEPSADFPSLAAAAAVTKPKKKKVQTFSLAEFTASAGQKTSGPAYEPKGLTHEDLMMLPTGPRQRTAEELDRSRLGGGFRNYGSNGSYDRNSRYSGGDESSNSRWGSSRGFDETRRSNSGSRESARDFAPSRADEIDNWALAKKTVAGNGFERKERGFFSDSSSKADESDSWISNKTSAPSEGRRFGSSGGGFDRERKGWFNSNGGGADSDSWGRKKEDISPGSVSERPRLNLQPRTLPVTNDKPDAPVSAAKPKGSNPFGEARPREEVLAEKGQDWKKIDEQLESMKIKDVAEKVEKANGTSFGKKSFGIGNGRASEDRTGGSWRKPESADDANPESSETIEDGPADKIDDGPVEEN